MFLPTPALLDRRHMLRALAATAIVGATAGCADLIPQGLGLALTPSGITDPAVYNFALNLEYLEAEYYRRGVYGDGLAADLIGPNPGGVAGGRQVSFRTPYIQEFMAEIAEDETDHVRFLRHAIHASPLIEISRPAIDFTNAFRAAGHAAGLGEEFDPFADEQSFLLGAFLFEDVGVSAYVGASQLIAGADSIEAAAGILAVEGYHAGLVRAQIADMGPAMIQRADAISAARDRLDGPAPTEQPIVDPTASGEIVIAPGDAAGRAFSRTPQQVLNIVFMNPDTGVHHGGFFPDNYQGVVSHTMLDLPTDTAHV